jgi:hypothetical protein
MQTMSKVLGRGKLQLRAYTQRVENAVVYSEAF